MRTRFISFCLIFFISACSTVRVTIKSDYETRKNHTGSMEYSKSYSVGGIQWACILTGIFYGGACWGYLGLPYDMHSAQIKADAKKAIAEELGVADATLTGLVISRNGWSDQPPQLALYENEGEETDSESEVESETESEAVKKSKPANKSDVPVETSDEFLR